jgi:hypothetical protein
MTVISFYVVLLLIVCWCASNVWTSSVDAATCDGGGVCAQQFLVMRNGGNNTGSEPVLTATFGRQTDLSTSLLQWAEELGYAASDAGSLSLRDASGAEIGSLSDVRAGQIVFVVPTYERWIWPGLYLGTILCLISIVFKLISNVFV